MVQAILFDFWGTLAENGIYSPLKQVKDLLGLQEMGFSEYVVRLEKAMMLSEFADLNESFRAVLVEFGITQEDSIIDEMVGLWNKNWMMAHLYDETKEVIENLRKDHQVVLVSNTDCFSIKNVMEKFDVAKLFDHIFLSCEVGLLKSDPHFFYHISRSLNIPKEELVMVGDSIQSDIMGAKRAGVEAILVDRKDKRDFPKKVVNLKEVRGLL